MKEFLAISYLFSPLLVGLAFHGVCMKFGVLSFLSKPIDGGRTFRGKRIFGVNKTYRGIIAVGLGTSMGIGIQAFFLHRFTTIKNIELLDYTTSRILILGFVLGAAAMLSELPNSFIKRQFDIAPGAAAKGTQIAIFYVADQIDFLIGTWIVLLFFVSITFERVLWSVLFMVIAHQIVTSLGYAIGLRVTAR